MCVRVCQVLSETEAAAGAAEAAAPGLGADGLDTTAFEESVRLFERIEADIEQLIVDQVLVQAGRRCEDGH